MIQDINEDQVREIVAEVVNRVLSHQTTEPSVSSSKAGVGGVFQEVEAAVAASRRAQEQLLSTTLEDRTCFIDAIRATLREQAEEFAHCTLEETGMGRFEDKVRKHHVAAENTPGVEDLQAVSWTGDHGLTVVEMAPYGVIAAVTPSTHPVPTMASNAIGMIAAGNAGVFNAHPAAKKISANAVQKFNAAIVDVGGPANLITVIEDPTVESATELFNHADVDVILVTGGPVVARAAMSCPKKAIVAGPGNPPVVVDETADLERAARDIVDGAAFDNNLLCIGEKQVFVVDTVADELKSRMVRYSAYELNAEQIERLAQESFVSEYGGESRLNRNLVGRNASVLGARLGLQLEDSLRLLIGETGADHIFVREEQMMPFLPIVRVPNIDQAIRAAVESEQGYGHTAVIHSRNIENMHNMACAVDTTVFVKNGPSYAGLGIGGEGFGTYSIAGPTGEGFTSARTFTRQRRCALVDYFRIT